MPSALLTTGAVRVPAGAQDLHVEHRENREWLEELPPLFSEDGLLIAGDVCTSLSLFRTTLGTLVPKFKHVFWCAGNHELWVSPSDIAVGVEDSIEKFFALLQIATDAGAHAGPAVVHASAGAAGAASPSPGNPSAAAGGVEGAELLMLPLHSWYHAGFLSEEVLTKARAWEERVMGRMASARRGAPAEAPPATPLSPTTVRRALEGEEHVDAAEETFAGGGAGGAAQAATAGDTERDRVRRKEELIVSTMDAQCLWPACFAAEARPGGRTKVELLSDFFARLNRSAVDAALAALASQRRPQSIITYSHFLPHPKLHRGPIFLGEIEGSADLGAQVDSLKPDVHVFGHTHWDIDSRIGGVHYVQKPLGYPKERAHREDRRIKISTDCYTNWAESPPLAMVWGLSHL